MISFKKLQYFANVQTCSINLICDSFKSLGRRSISQNISIIIVAYAVYTLSNFLKILSKETFMPNQIFKF